MRPMIIIMMAMVIMMTKMAIMMAMMAIGKTTGCTTAEPRRYNASLWL